MKLPEDEGMSASDATFQGACEEFGYQVGDKETEEVRLLIITIKKNINRAGGKMQNLMILRYDIILPSLFC